MVSVSGSEAALLGLLCEKPMHGYEIEKTLEVRNMRYWTEISFYSIYRVLRKLEDKGLVESRIRLSENNVSQKVYAVTEEGRVATKCKILENLSSAQRMIWQIDLAIANIDMLDQDEAIGCLGQYISSVEKIIGDYEMLDELFQTRGYPERDRALALRPLAHYRAEKAWATDYVKVLKKRDHSDRQTTKNL